MLGLVFNYSFSDLIIVLVLLFATRNDRKV